MLFLVLLSVVSASSADGGFYDRAVAMIDGRVMTHSELQVEARVFLIDQGGVEAANATLDDATLRAALQLAIAQRVEVAEAEKLKAYAIDEAEVEAALASFKRRFADQGQFDDFLKRNELEEAELVSILARKLRAERVLDNKFRLKSQVSEAEARRAQKDDLSSASVELLRQKLTRDRFAQLVSQEVQRAFSASSVRLLGPYARVVPKVRADGGVP